MGRCIHENCKTSASFNNINDITPLYCAKHKKDNMVDIRNIKKQCTYDNCTIRAVYNYSNEKKGIYCSKHKKDIMIDVMTKKCNETLCNLQPSYNYSNEKKGIYCSKHKKDNMIDVKHNMCQEPECNILASFNYINNKKAIYCLNHKKEDMIDIRAPKCKEDNCLIYPCYNYINYKQPIYCNKHKKEDMIDVINKHCNTPLCTTIVSNKKYEGYCFYCYYNLFPDSPISRNYKTKEKSISDYILEKFKEIDIVIDRQIYDGCSKRRPDIFIDLGYQVIIIEIDENQHISYESICENKRLMEISKDINHRPLVFIRFNPDSYNDNNTKIESCWTINKQGICIIKKDALKEWNNRLNILSDTINKWITTTSSKTIEVIHLFYDKTK